MPVSCVCQNPTCGTSFRRSPAEIRKGGGKYCSWKCRPRLVTAQGLREPQDIATRLWDLVQVCIHGPTCPYCCWDFQGKRAHGKWKYGLLSIVREGKSIFIRTHRLMWETINGRPVPRGLWILHHCDQPACNNPWHLYPGTAKDNTRDAVQRDRFPHDPGHPILRGEALGHGKLTEAKVRNIRARYAAGESNSVIAADLQVSRKTIYLVVKRKLWTHVS